MPVAIDKYNLKRIKNNTPNATEQFIQLIDNVSLFGSIQQIQQFMVQFLSELKVNNDLILLQNILLTMLSSSKHLLHPSQLQRLIISSQHIASLPICNEHKNPLSPSPSPIINTPNTTNTNTPLYLPKKRSSSLPLSLSLSLYNIKIKPITHIFDLPDHILSYCCSYLATKDLLLSADLCCTQLCGIARMPSSFHGKFIFGSAIHSEYHKRSSIDTAFNGFKMLQRFHHSKEIHFINIFNYDTIRLLQTCNFPKIESIYLYDRFNHLIQYLPVLIPNVAHVYITTNGGNETMDIIQANTEYYCHQLYVLFTGYCDSIQSLELQHNTYYDIPLMLPEKVSTLLLNQIPNISHLSLKNVYFPPDLNVDECVYDSDYDTALYHSAKHIRLMPYNEYCAHHFDASLRSLSLYWNIVGENQIYDMVKLHDLERLHLSVKLDNDSLDYDALQQVLIQSECLLQLSHFEFDIDLNDAIWSSFGELLKLTKTIFSILIYNSSVHINETKEIKINIIDICNATSYSHMFRTILPQIIGNIIRDIKGNTLNIEIDVKHCIPDSDHDYYSHCMKNAIRDIQMNCCSILNHNKYQNKTSLKFIVANEMMFHLMKNDIETICA